MTGVNLPLLNKVMEHIEAHPEEHFQGNWAMNFTAFAEYEREQWEEDIQPIAPCGTAYCFAGHTVHMAGGEIDFGHHGSYKLTSSCVIEGVSRNIDAVARELLGLSYHEATALFSSRNTRAELRWLVDELNAGRTIRPA